MLTCCAVYNGTGDTVERRGAMAYTLEGYRLHMTGF